MRLLADVGRLERQWLEVIDNAIDKRQFAEVTTPGADVEFTVTHGLGFIPLGYLVTKKDKAAVVYDSTTTWTTESVFLKCNVATTTIRILIF